MKKANNQGFSLVELIIVIAIMAVLVGVLAPQFIKYVESSREQKDNTNLDNVQNAIEVALTDEEVYQEVVAHLAAAGDTVVVTIDADDGSRTYSEACPDLEAELAGTISDFELSSTDYAAGATITISQSGGVFTYVIAP